MSDFDDDDEGGGEGSPAWMATFGDMMSLLLTFFVLLLSFANMDVVKFREALGSVQDALGVEQEHPGQFEGRTTNPIELSKTESTALLDLMELPTRQSGAASSAADEQMLSSIQKMVSDEGLDDTVDAELSERGVVLRVRGQLLFDPGSAELLPASLPLLGDIADIAKRFPHRLLIEGHTDDIPVRSAQYPSNWHLSASRAIAALRQLAEVGQVDPKRLACSGYADMVPLVPNDSPSHRAMNRRIEFVFQHDSSLESRALF